MLKQVLKRFLPAAVRRPLRRVLDGTRHALLRPGTLRRAAQPRSRLEQQRGGRPTVVFFAPEAGVRPYIQAQAALAVILRAQGCNVVFARCFGLLPRCPVKDALLLPFDAAPEQHERVCLQCFRDSEALLDEPALDYLDLREVLDDGARARVEAALQSVPEGGLDFRYEGINVGALAFYDFAISHKHPIGHAMSAADRAAWLTYARNAMLAIEMARGLVGRFRPVAFACFDEYSMMSAARLYAGAHGAATRLISTAFHLDGDYRRLVAMSRATVVKEYDWRRGQWARWRSQPLSPPLVAQAADDIVHRLTRSGAHIYSPNKTGDTSALKARLALDPGRRVLVAYTSSTDEHDALLLNLRGLGIEYAPPQDAFADTFAWLHALIGHVEASGDLQLVVRVHPRVGATARDGRAAVERERYRREFGAGYRHCRFIWPEERVSSYDLAEFADLALISWSGIGLELARLGVPVLSGNRSVMTIGPGEDFIRHEGTPEGYFRSLREMAGGLARPAEQLRLCYRWYHLMNLAGAVDLSDVLGARGPIADPSAARLRGLVRDVFLGDTEALDVNFAALAEAVPAGSISSRSAETAALRGQLGRLVEFLATARDPAAPVHLGADAQDWRGRSKLVARLLDIEAALGEEAG